MEDRERRECDEYNKMVIGILTRAFEDIENKKNRKKTENLSRVMGIIKRETKGIDIDDIVF